MKAFTLLVAIALMMPAASAAQAPAPVERSNTRGLDIGLHLGGATLEFENTGITENGGGVGLRLGWGFTESFGLYSQFDFANMQSTDGQDNYVLGQLDVGSRIGFRGRSARIRPYVDVAVSGRAAQMDFQGAPMTMSGAAFTMGAGIQWFFSRSKAVDIGFKGTSGTFTRMDYRGDVIELDDTRAASSRVNLGFSFHPGG